MQERRDAGPYPFEYEALNGLIAICEIRIYQHEGKTTVIATDLDAGPSVTNNVERIATLLRQRGLQWDVFCEHYLDQTTVRLREPETFDWVDFEWEDDIASQPHWRPGTRVDLERLIGRRFE